jgi:hypothetical protein
LTGVYKNMNLGVVSLAFRCSLAGGEARTSEESKAVSWRTLEEIKRDVPEARAVRVFDALHASGVPVRIHDGSELIESISPGTVLQPYSSGLVAFARNLRRVRAGCWLGLPRLWCGVRGPCGPADGVGWWRLPVTQAGSSARALLAWSSSFCRCSFAFWS